MVTNSISGSDRPSTSSQQRPAFDPNAVGTRGSNLFGLPFSCDEAAVVVIPVPWEVTVTYGAGTARGPQTVFDASGQIDLFDPDGVKIWETGVAMPEVSSYWIDQNDRLREKASDYITALAESDDPNEEEKWADTIAEINQVSTALNAWVESEATRYLDAGKLVGVVGGDHSSPLGLMQALAKRYPDYSILHVDAHADLRVAFEGFEFSHASIMDNALKLPQVSRLVQVGIRDIGPAEAERIENGGDRLNVFFDWTVKERMFQGQTWHQLCDEIIAALSDRVYVSFDIDGLDPAFCPHTGTPVPGGLRFEEATYLLKRLVQSGKKIIGFDLCEVAPGDSDWDGNVGARVLYRLVSSILQSNGMR